MTAQGWAVPTPIKSTSALVNVSPLASNATVTRAHQRLREHHAQGRPRQLHLHCAALSCCLQKRSKHQAIATRGLSTTVHSCFDATGVAHRALHERITVLESIMHRVVFHLTVCLHCAVPSLRLLNSKQSRAVSNTGSSQRFSRNERLWYRTSYLLRSHHGYHEH